MALDMLNLSDLQLPITLYPSVPVTDDELIRFSERNKPYRFERNTEGAIVMMTPVGGIGGTHEQYIASMLFSWTEQNASGISFGSNTGFNLPDGSCLSPRRCMAFARSVACAYTRRAGRFSAALS